MNDQLKEIINILNEYEDSLEKDINSDLQIANIEERLRNYFSSEPDKDMLQQAELIMQKLTRVMDLLDEKMHKIKIVLNANNKAWGSQRKYLETLQLQKKESWNS